MNKKNKIIVGIICLITLITLGGMTYAYFSRGDVIGNENEKVVTLTADYGEIIVTYPDDNKISMSNIDLKENDGNASSILKFTVENTGNISQDIKIRWKDVLNNFCQYQSNNSCTDIESDEYVGDELQYMLYECQTEEIYNTVEHSNLTTCEALGEFKEAVPLTGDIGALNHTGRLKLEPGVNYYVLEVELLNKATIQDYNQGRSFSGTLEVILNGEETTTLEGVLLDAEGSALTDVEIALHSEPQTTITDEYGYYRFDNVRFGNHNLIIDEQNYQIEVIESLKNGIRKTKDEYELRNDEYGMQINIISGENGIELQEAKRAKIIVHNGKSSEQEVAFLGKERIVEITANEGYNVDGAILTCESGITANLEDNNLVISNIETDGTCEINIPIYNYTIDANTTYGTLSKSANSVDYGESVTITLGEETTYETHICESEYTSITKSDNVITITGIKSNIICNIQSYPVITFSITNGTLNSDKMTYKGETLTNEITGNTGYNESEATLSCDDGIEGSITNGVLSITNAVQNGSCSVNVPIYTYTFSVTSNNTSYGTVAVSTNPVNYNGTGKFTITNVNGTYNTTTCTGTAGTPTVSGTTISVPNITSNVSCTAKFYPKITISVTGGKVGSSTIYYQGSNVGTTITANSGYNINSATVSCTSGITASKSGSTLTITGATKNGSCSVVLKSLYLVDLVSVGNYVTYKPTTSSYTTAPCSGLVDTVSLTPSTVTSWRVLKKTGSGSTGTVELIATSANGSFRTCGNVSKACFVNGLNTMARAYINSTYASSARNVGYNASCTVADTGTASTSTGCNTDSCYTADYNILSANGMLAAGSEYWLSSRAGCTNTGQGTGCLTCSNNTNGYGWRSVTAEGALSAGYTWAYAYASNTSYNTCNTKAFRPIVTIKAGIKSTSGSGTSSSPFVLST